MPARSPAARPGRRGSGPRHAPHCSYHDQRGRGAFSNATRMVIRVLARLEDVSTRYVNFPVECGLDARHESPRRGHIT
jgi:hypothetical protein